MVLETTSATVNRMLYKVFKTSLLEITISLQKAKKAKIITENVDFHSNIIWTLHSKTLGASFLLSLQASHNRKAMLGALNNMNPPSLARIVYLSVQWEDSIGFNSSATRLFIFHMLSFNFRRNVSTSCTLHSFMFHQMWQRFPAVPSNTMYGIASPPHNGYSSHFRVVPNVISTVAAYN